ncbi:uncharacterized protein [Clytia hemisphaerica]|uniref:uncharacterized protein n=1 Tax=Clytia hemisphaerica TaxID=252671 RepID=UPI0034D68C9F
MMFPAQTERRRSHTFSEGVFDEAVKAHEDLLSPETAKKNDLCRQYSEGSPASLKRTDTRSPILQKLHKKFFSHEANSPTNSLEDLTPRSRSGTGNSIERFFKRDDNCEFEIPVLTPPRSPLTSPNQRSLGGSPINGIGELDIDLYKNYSSESDDSIVNEEPRRMKHEKLKTKSSLADSLSQDGLVCSFEKLRCFQGDEEERIKTNSVGSITLSFRYVRKEHHLLIKLIDINLNYKPSFQVRETHWTIQPYLVIDTFRDSRSPTEKGKFHLFHKHHQPHIMTKDETCELNIKNKTSEGHLLKVVLYDGDILNKDLAVGTVHFQLSNLLTMDGSEMIVTKDLAMFHEIYHRQGGTLTSSLQWHSRAMLFKMHIESISFNKDFQNIKELFIKTTIYVGNEEYVEYRTDSFSASKDLQVEQTYNIELTPDKIRNMFIVIQIFEKHLIGSISLHRTVIGPYMRPTLKDETVSAWEKMIVCPGEEVKCICNLYH